MSSLGKPALASGIMGCSRLKSQTSLVTLDGVNHLEQGSPSGGQLSGWQQAAAASLAAPDHRHPKQHVCPADGGTCVTLPLHSSRAAAPQPTGSSARCWPGASATTLTQGGVAKGTALALCLHAKYARHLPGSLVAADLLRVGGCKPGCCACAQRCGWVMGACRHGNFVLQAPQGLPSGLESMPQLASSLTLLHNIEGISDHLPLARCRHTTFIRKTCVSWLHSCNETSEPPG